MDTNKQPVDPDQNQSTDTEAPAVEEQLGLPRQEAKTGTETPVAEEQVVVEEAAADTSEENTNTTETVTDEAAEAEEEVVSEDAASDIDLYDFLDSSDAHWYVVHTYSGHEKKVSQALKQRVASMRLQDKILDILVPTQEKIEVRKGKKEQFKEKIFPGYILVRMVVDDYSWLAVRTTPGVTGFVGAGNKPTPIPDEEVKAIQKFMSMEAPKYKAVFSVGEAVKIIEGPFAEFLGTVDNIDEAKGKIKVLVSIFGRETPVELDFLQVSKL